MKKLLLASLGALAIAQAPTAVLARPMTAEDLATFRRIAAPTVSPDGKWAVYQLRETDLAANTGKTDLVTLMWSNEFSDSALADSVPVDVSPAEG